MNERTGAGGDRIDDALGDDHRSERRISAGESFCGHQYVWGYTPVFNREVAAGASHTGHDFVGDQQDVMGAAYIGDVFQIAGRRDYGAERRPADRFENDGGNFAVRASNGLFDLGSVFLSAFEAAIRAVVGAAITIRSAHAGELPHHGPVDFAAVLIPRDRDRAQGCAVIAFVPADDLRSLVFAYFNLILPGEL